MSSDECAAKEIVNNFESGTEAVTQNNQQIEEGKFFLMINLIKLIFIDCTIA